MRDIEAQAKALAPIIKQAIDNAVNPLLEKIAALESTVQTERDKDSDAESIKALVTQAISEIEMPLPKDGENGKDGADGKNGVDGKDADPELIKDLVDKAVSEIHIPEPRHGEDGKDALQLEILPEIDEEKSYPRNTYAKHNGGLFRSFEKTHGLRGWECIVDGVTDFHIEMEDERTFKLSSSFASGRVNEKSFSLPVVLDRGVYRDTGVYKAGDGVTWGGSFWIGEQDPEGKPGDPRSKGWRLAVKRGRDGKDGKNGKDLTKGVSIK